MELWLCFREEGGGHWRISLLSFGSFFCFLSLAGLLIVSWDWSADWEYTGMG